ncbi:hypothetical protein [Methylomarinum vadi]|uniref:hypothetical protein n=1 Tax=Methylomarinum vadi TaxID=438855 RepID=UPI0004DF6295|nr:hypothetical protein [Methylomarinum vadi]
MSGRREYSKKDLNPHWMVVIAFVLFLCGYLFACHYFGSEIQINIADSQRVLIRTILYALAIVIFPVTSLLRYILLRLNQTMPGDKSAKSRYLVTIIVTQAMIGTVAAFGLVMFVLGDDYNTLYIFSSMAALGIFLHRPKFEEYNGIFIFIEERKLKD